MNRRILMMIALLASVSAGLFAQGGGGAGGGGSGDLGQMTLRNMQTAMDDLINEGLEMPSSQSLEQKLGKAKVDAFLKNAVVKLTLKPDGAYEALALEGGEIISFKLGKAKLTPGEDEEYEDGWLIRLGAFEIPKKAQKLSLELRAGPTKVVVDCHNKYSKSEEPVTFYVGPLDGLFCVGFTEGDDAENQDEVG